SSRNMEPSSSPAPCTEWRSCGDPTSPSSMVSDSTFDVPAKLQSLVLIRDQQQRVIGVGHPAAHAAGLALDAENQRHGGVHQVGVPPEVALGNPRLELRPGLIKFGELVRGNRERAWRSARLQAAAGRRKTVHYDAVAVGGF